jgi:flagellar hook-associated protein 3 FlgL
MSVSFSRLGSTNTYDNALANLSDRQAGLSKLQEQLTSGKKVVNASDDPTGAAQAERSLTRISRIATDQRALESQRSAITMAESTLGDVADSLQRFRELVVGAGNGIQSASDRKSTAVELSGLRDQILSLANRKDTNGLPLFSALGSALAPFTGPSGPPQDYTFNGKPGQTASSEFAIPSALDGDSAFMLQSARDGSYNVNMSNSPTAPALPGPPPNLTSGLVTPAPLPVPPAVAVPLVPDASYSIKFDAIDTVSTPLNTTASYSITESPSGTIYTGSATYTTGKPATINVTEMPGLTLTLKGTPALNDTVAVNPNPSLFSVLDNAIRDIGGAASGNAATQAVAQALANIDIGMGRVSAIRGQAGDLMNRADRITTDQEKRTIQLESDRSRAEDIDLVKGHSDFQNQQTGYQVALQSYAQIQKLSLFNYIG